MLAGLDIERRRWHSGELFWHHVFIFPTPHSTLSHWELKISTGKIIYTTAIGKHYKSGVFFSEEQIIKHLSPHQWKQSFVVRNFHSNYCMSFSQSLLRSAVLSSFYRWKLRPHNLKWLAENPVACAPCCLQATYKNEGHLDFFFSAYQIYIPMNIKSCPLKTSVFRASPSYHTPFSLFCILLFHSSDLP